MPDVPVDLAAVADPIDTLLKNVIGGVTAPSGPLTPNLLDASASIGSLNETQSTQQSQITTMQGQISALSATPWAAATSRQSSFSIAGNTKTPTQVHSHQLPAFNDRRLLLAYANLCLGWSSSSETAAVRARLQVRADGSSTYLDRNVHIQTGNDQAHSLFFLETVDAGRSVGVRLAVDVYGSASSSVSVRTQSLDPRIYLLALPWTGSAVPYLPTLPPL